MELFDDLINSVGEVFDASTEIVSNIPEIVGSAMDAVSDGIVDAVDSIFGDE